MKLSDLARGHPVEFAALCKTLREAGVTELGPLKLGPLPSAARAASKDEDPNAEALKKHRIMFAACRTVPPFEPRIVESDTPRAIVQRRARDEAAGGTTIKSR